MNERSPLTKLRQQIDQIDYQIHDLLNERATLALQVAKEKIAEQGESVNFYRPEREKEILQHIADYNKGPLTPEAVTTIFKAIIKECLELQIHHHPKST